MLHPIFQDLLKPFSGAITPNINCHSTERPRLASKSEDGMRPVTDDTPDSDWNDLGGDAA